MDAKMSLELLEMLLLLLHLTASSFNIEYLVLKIPLHVKQQ